MEFRSSTRRAGRWAEGRRGRAERDGRRRHPRIPWLGPLTALAEGGARVEGPGDLGRGGCLILSEARLALGEAVTVGLPRGEAGPLLLPGRVLSSDPRAAPLSHGGQPLRTFFCLECGWVGYVEPSDGSLRWHVGSGAAMVSGILHEPAAEPLVECPQCGGEPPRTLTAPIFGVAVQFDDLKRPEEQALIDLLEQVAARAAKGDRRREARHPADLVPMTLTCAFKDGEALLATYAMDISPSGLRVVRDEEVPPGQEVRIVLAVGGREFKVTGRVASRTQVAGQARFEYGIELVGFSDADREELRRFVESSVDRDVTGSLPALEALDEPARPRVGVAYAVAASLLAALLVGVALVRLLR